MKHKNPFENSIFFTLLSLFDFTFLLTYFFQRFQKACFWPELALVPLFLSVVV